MAYKKKGPVQRIPFEPKFAPTPDQQAIFDQFKLTDDNLLCNAVAGSGKSTTLAWLMTMTNVPGAYIAFNRDIVNEMEPRCPYSVDVKTRHAYGYAAFMKAVGKRPNIQDNLVYNILEQFGYPHDKDDDGSYERRKNMKLLIDQMRNNLTNPEDRAAIDQLAFFYAVDIDCYDEFLDKIPHIFRKLISDGEQGIIDFIGMKWIPVVCNWKIKQYPLLYLDEYQDSSTLDMEFDKRMVKDDGRVVMVGDPHQSIYGFAGANCDSIDIARNYWEATDCPLYVTFRCGKKIVEACQSMVPHFKAWEGAKEGEVRYMDEKIPNIDFSTMHPQAMFLCRRNAPLVRPCFNALKQGIRANIKGRDIGAQLSATIRDLKGDTLSQMLDSLEVVTENKKQKILNRAKPNPNALEALDDTREIINAFAEQAHIQTLDDLHRHIKDMFVEDGPGLMFSSCHKSKGLEAEQVNILEYSRIRLHYEGMTPEAKQQEANLEYVAKSRAKGKLWYAEQD